jgi:NadR type nicotinamide-nucleotide adenylyltransferase
MGEVKKIALLGPESTGKSFLCEQLAKHFKTVWVPEFARGYILNLNEKYSFEDVLHSAKEQLRLEEDMKSKANQFLFCDTEFINFKVWCEDVFKKTPSWIEETIQKNRYDLFLLTSPDIPFEEDAVRENPNRRDFFFEWYQKELERYGFAFEIVKGFGDARVKSALSAIEKHFPEKKSAT